MKLTFNRYSKDCGIDLRGEPLTLRQLCTVSAFQGNILARAEESGSEACYVEIARWNYGSSRWERFAFEKLFGGELWEKHNSRQTCARLAEIINRRTGAAFRSFVHLMPSYDPATNAA